MATNFQINISTDLNSPLETTKILQSFQAGDKRGHSLCITLYYGKTPVPKVSGTVNGYFQTEDSATPYNISGSIQSDNTVVVDIPAAAYAAEGNVVGIVRLSDSSNTTTIAKVVFDVVEDVDQDGTVPVGKEWTTSELASYLDRLEADVDTFEAELASFNAKITAVKTDCARDSILLSNVSNAIRNSASAPLEFLPVSLESGAIQSTSGDNSSNTKRCRTKADAKLSEITIEWDDSVYGLYIYKYSYIDGSFSKAATITATTSPWSTPDHYQYRIVFARTDNAVIASDEIDTLQRSVRVYKKDTGYNQIANNAHDVVIGSGSFTKTTHNGVTYSFDGSQCIAYGTASAYSFATVLDSRPSMPAGIAPGETYVARFSSTNSKLRASILPFIGSTEGQKITISSDCMVTIPDDTTAIIVRYEVASGAALSGVATAKLELFANPITERWLRRNVIADDLFKSLRGTLTIIDDDTVNTTYVKAFRDVLTAEGVTGTYATITQVPEGHDDVKQLLLQYEDEGFHCAYHCYKQVEAYRLPSSGKRDMSVVRANFNKGLRYMRSNGFIAPDYWVTPYGSADEDLQNLAMRSGMRCLVSISQKDYNHNDASVNGWAVKRVGLNSTDSTGSSTLAELKAIMQDAADHNGWVLVGTHFGDGTWETNDPNHSRVTDVIQYAKSLGLDILPLHEAYEKRHALCEFWSMFR